MSTVQDLLKAELAIVRVTDLANDVYEIVGVDRFEAVTDAVLALDQVPGPRLRIRDIVSRGRVCESSVKPRAAWDVVQELAGTDAAAGLLQRVANRAIPVKTPRTKWSPPKGGELPTGLDRTVDPSKYGKHLMVENCGPEVVGTNYHESSYNAAGAFFLTFNAGAVRVLVPSQAAAEVQRELCGTQVVEVAFGRYAPDRFGYRLVFEDGSRRPFLLAVGIEQADRRPPPTESGRSLEVLVYGPGPTLLARFPGKLIYGVDLTGEL